MGGFFSFVGIFRSIIIVTVYVMTVTGFGWRDVFEVIKVIRFIVNFNLGFR